MGELMVRRLFAGLSCVLVVVVLGAAPARSDPVPTMLGISAAVIAGISLAFDVPELDTDRDFVNIGVGYFDPIDRDNTSVEFAAEYWTPWTWKNTRIIGGAFGTTDGGFGAYLAIHHELFLSDNLLLSVETGPAIYSSGGGNNLGSYALLRSGAGVAYRFDNASRISLMLRHMSHGKIFSDRNPGVESLVLSYAIPLDRLFGR